MNGQYLCNRQKDTKGERHGTPAERVLAASNPTAQKSRPHTLFASGPPTLSKDPQANGTMGTPMPPRPFANGAVPLGPIPPVRPPPPQGAIFPPFQGQPPLGRVSHSSQVRQCHPRDASASVSAVQTRSPKHATATSSTGRSWSFKASPTTNGNGGSHQLFGGLHHLLSNCPGAPPTMQQMSMPPPPPPSGAPPPPPASN